MKKIVLLFLSIFLVFSCTQNKDSIDKNKVLNSWITTEKTVNNSWSTENSSGSLDSSTKKASTSAKSICDSVTKWKSFDEIKIQYWEPSHLVESIELSTYTYWEASESCSIYVKDWKVTDKVYVKL